MSGIRISGNTTGNVAEVTSTNQLKVKTPDTITDAGMSILVSQNDDGSFSDGIPVRRSPTTSTDLKLAVGLDTPVFDSSFTSVAQDSGIWKCFSTTMTITQGGGLATFNASSLGTTTIGAQLQTWRYFSMVNNGGMRISIVGSISNALPANQVIEMGWFPGGTPTVEPVEGIFFRLTSAGLIGIITYNGNETPTGILNSTMIQPNEIVDFQLRINTDLVEFWADGRFLGRLFIPVANPQATMFGTLPICVMMRNSGTVTGPQQFRLGHVSVDYRDNQLAMPFDYQMAFMGLHGSQGTSGNVMGSTALYGNNLAPGAGVVMTNTTAALGVGLGGQFAALPTLAANTDGVLCSYQVPVGTINIRPRVLVITGVRVQGVVTTVLAGNATPVIYALALAYGHTNVSAATTEGASFSNNTSKTPRRIPLGYETYPAAAALGTLGSTGVYMPFSSPIMVNPGEFVAILAKNVGVVTTTGVITFLVTYDSHWA